MRKRCATLRYQSTSDMRGKALLTGPLSFGNSPFANLFSPEILKHDHWKVANPSQQVVSYRHVEREDIALLHG